MKIIVNADDFGWTHGHNLAVERAHRKGILNSASIMSVGNGFDEAAAVSKRNPDLRVGVHLTLNEAHPLSNPDALPRLTRSDGRFHDTLRALGSLWVLGRLQTNEVVGEWRMQVDRALRSGVSISHLDSHKHVHMFPPLRRAIIQIAKEYEIPYVRLPREPWGPNSFQRGPSWAVLWMLAVAAEPALQRAGLKFADRFFGVAQSGNMILPHLENAIKSAGNGVTEIMVHPAVVTPGVQALIENYKWAQQYQFEVELDALCKLKHSTPRTS